MNYYVSASALRGGDGSAERPFCKINDAALIAMPGDEVIVAPGIYREWVAPAHAGTLEARIAYRSAVPRAAVITGAEQISDWDDVGGGIWRTKIDNRVFGTFNPYTELIKGDWYFSAPGYHTGEVFYNGNAMYEVLSMEDLRSDEPIRHAWHPEQSLMRWYTEQEENCTVIYANFRGRTPENTEISVRRNCFSPKETGISYITISGFDIRCAATQWAPPTAFQDGMVAPHWSKGWIIEDCEISNSRCSGISLGKYLQPENENKWTTKYYKDGTQTERDAVCQAQAEGWNRDNIGSHVVRRCEIHDCGQTGIVGHLGGVFSLIEDNHIHHINNKQDITGAEIGGIKMHAAIDVIIRRNHIHDCTRGLWLDWQAQGTRVTQNFFHDNVAPAETEIPTDIALGEDLFIEVSHGPTLVDNNIFLSPFACRLSTQGIAFVHNLIAGSFTFVGLGTDNGSRELPSPRYTPYHMPHSTTIAGFMTILHGDARFYNNIFAELGAAESRVRFDDPGLNTVCGTKPYDGWPAPEEYFGMFSSGVPKNRDCYYKKLPVYSGGNVFLGGAQPCAAERGYAIAEEAVRIEYSDGVMVTDIFRKMPKIEVSEISTETLGTAFEPEQMFEAPDGSPIVFDTDYFGTKRTVPVPGPFAVPADKIKLS